MVNDADDLIYNYDGIDTVAAAIAAFVRQMDENLREVDGAFKDLLANGWTGAGADAFHQESTQWHAAADEIATTLGLLGTAVGNAGLDMRAADGRAAGRFFPSGG
ncbi:WXG100 family type VII secretion target [Frankia sp. QA3]|uniref:WXG100 family type VII secretion target n=1 Tax=Frankia sp. QA3 TaxID=710111 RepID=UPI000269BBF8|nr:WXG100 family type VII secretion target [Frankia sp. QA3]EIV92647.1 WXG100 family type VII secretion target [Frankia sp. QA3]